jgi:hypothetical protein
MLLAPMGGAPIAEEAIFPAIGAKAEIGYRGEILSLEAVA